MGQKTSSMEKGIEGKVKEIVPKSGAIERCPECNRVLVDDDICVVHGEVSPVEDLRIKAKLDGNAKIFILNGEVAEKLLGVTTESAHALPENDMASLINGKVKGEKFRFTGKDKGENFIVKEFETL